MTNSKALRRPKIVAITGLSGNQKYNLAAGERAELFIALLQEKTQRGSRPTAECERESRPPREKT